VAAGRGRGHAISGRLSDVPEKLTVDLHPVFRSDQDVELAVRTALFRAAAQKVPLLEIITGKGSGKLRSRVLAKLKQPHVKKLYRRVELAPGNDGVVLVHLR
jgi:dsDNA-specific endonuclease/ATPase MutS2